MVTRADNSRMIFEAVLFDCDGVLVDSEAITCGVLRDMLEEKGWSMSVTQCMEHFVGHTGTPLTDAFMDEFYRRRNVRLETEITLIDGALEAVQYWHAQCQGRIAVASGADRYKIEMMLQRVGLSSYFEGRIFSGHETPRSKPFPDVYLAAAAHLQVDPARCLVVEDTPIGVTAGVAAGATVWGYAPANSIPDTLHAAGAVQVFEHMHQLRLNSSGV